MVDKYEVKKYVSKIIGEEYIIPTFGVWDCFDDIEFDQLPNEFVLKCTHDSGGIVIVKDRQTLDISSAKKRLNKFLKRKYYNLGREWPYKYVKPRIIAEKYMTDESGYELKDYKIYNFNGEPRMIQVDYDRFVSHKRNIYTPTWEYMDVSIKYPTDKNRVIKRPERLDEMLRLARLLSKDYPHLRTDFYSINEKVYFGELTFYPESGFAKFYPEVFEYEVGSWMQLPEKNL